LTDDKNLVQTGPLDVTKLKDESSSVAFSDMQEIGLFVFHLLQAM
jgi:hypothetical protein